MRRFTLLLLLLSGVAAADDEVLTVAVASNFLNTAEVIASRYTEDYGAPVRLVSGSTGKLYAQIVNGAPYDVFLAADDERPRLLESAGLTLDAQRLTYANGQLWLFSSGQTFPSGNCHDALVNGEFRKLAIANPATAPYGRAAMEYLESLGLADTYRPRLVYGESVSQVTHFVISGNAELGIGKPASVQGGCLAPARDGNYSAIRQQAVVLARTEYPQAAADFLDFLKQPEIRGIIVDDGYLTESQ